MLRLSQGFLNLILNKSLRICSFKVVVRKSRFFLGDTSRAEDNIFNVIKPCPFNSLEKNYWPTNFVIHRANVLTE